MLVNITARLDYTIIGILVSISAVFGGIYIALRQQLNQLSLKTFFLFLGLTAVYFFLLSLSSLWFISDVRWNYLLVVIFSFLGGTLFSRIMFVYRSPDLYNTQTDVVMNFFLNFIGATTYYLGYSLFSVYIPDELMSVTGSNSPIYASSACIAFSIPFFFYMSFIYLNQVPSPIYPQWLFPLAKDLPPFDYGDNDPQTGIRLQFSTRDNGGEAFLRGTYIPNEMILGDFIHIYFNTWNEDKERDLAVELTDEYGRAHAFKFFAASQPNSQSRRRLDPNKTALFNKLKREEVVIIERESRY